MKDVDDVQKAKLDAKLERDRIAAIRRQALIEEQEEEDDEELQALFAAIADIQEANRENTKH